MNQETKPEVRPASPPAPQLPNFPMSRDDPFQPDIERQMPVTPPPPDSDSDHAPRRPIPGRTRKKRRPATE